MYIKVLLFIIMIINFAFVGMNVDHPNSLGQTPLFLACFEGQRRLAKLLLKYGANPNV